MQRATLTLAAILKEDVIARQHFIFIRLTTSMSTKFRRSGLAERNPKKPIDKSKSPENKAICGETGEILPAATRRRHHLYNVKDSGTERIRERWRLKGRRIDDTIVPARNWHLPYVKAPPTRLSEPPKMFHLRIRIKEGGERYFIFSSLVQRNERISERLNNEVSYTWFYL